MNNPVYHLRPHKAVDRNLFIEVLAHLGRVIDFSSYRYIGFGSYEFDEFKQVYRVLGFEDMHSIEKDTDIFRRQTFNRPYSCIKLFNKTCSSYFDEDYDETKHSIIWADFTEANEKYSQCRDISNICSKIRDGDVLRVTFNANASSIPTGNVPPDSLPVEERKKYRFNWLKDNLLDYFPEGARKEDITNDKYPFFLLKVIKKAFYKDMNHDLSACPLCCYVYSDHMQMMTVTVLMCRTDNKKEIVTELQNSCKDWCSYINIDNWNSTIKIDLPPLTVHEQLEIGQYERNQEGIQEIENRLGIKEDDLRKYWLFSRYYPNYQPVLI